MNSQENFDIFNIFAQNISCGYMLIHYENLLMQYTEIFEVVKNANFLQKYFAIFLIFAQNID